MVSIALSYEGGIADNNIIDMYDAARGLAGFQRSLALTVHLALHGEIITQAPALKGAQILVSTPEAGSWKSTAKIIFSAATLTTIGAALVAPKDTVAGHLVFSMYDYVIHSTLGFDVNFDKSLRVEYEESLRKKKITPEKMDSLIEKAEASIADMHRPIVASQSANYALLFANPERSAPTQIGPLMSSETYAYISRGSVDERQETIVGKVASFNLNTYKGRIFVYEEQRPVPFELMYESRSGANTVAITSSLRSNSIARSSHEGTVAMMGRRNFSANGRLKSILVSLVTPES